MGQAYDALERKWEVTVAPMSVERDNFAVAVIDHKIFAIGGFTGEPTGITEVLDTKKNCWTILSPMSAPRQSMAVAVIDNRYIWTFGGYGYRLSSYIEVYDVLSGNWSTPPVSMTSPRKGAVAVTWGRKIFIIGGTGGQEGPLNLVETLDTDTLTWSTAAPMSLPRIGHTAGAIKFWNGLV